MLIALLPDPIMKNDAVESILAQGKQRAEAMNLPYAGALLPLEVHTLMQNVPGAKLIDVRTQAEWDYVGHVPESVLIEWNIYPSGHRSTVGGWRFAGLPWVQG